MNERVSIIIPTHNRCENLQIILDSILKSDYRNLEIIVVDNASTDETAKVMASFCGISPFAVHYVKNEDGFNVSEARKKGADSAKGEYLLFIDDDNRIYPDMISALVEFLNQHTGVGLAAPLSLGGAEGKNVGALGCGINLRTSRAVFRNSAIPLDQVELSGRYPTTAATNAFMMTREAYEKSGGWDPYLRISYEETDLGLRLHLAGYEQYYAPKARTLHLGAVAAGENSSLRGLGIGTRGRAYYFARNRSIMMRRYAGPVGKVFYFAFFLHVFTCYYVMSALRFGRLDLAWDYFKGAWVGCFCRTYSIE